MELDVGEAVRFESSAGCFFVCATECPDQQKKGEKPVEVVHVISSQSTRSPPHCGQK